MNDPSDVLRVEALLRSENVKLVTLLACNVAHLGTFAGATFIHDFLDERSNPQVSALIQEYLDSCIEAALPKAGSMEPHKNRNYFKKALARLTNEHLPDTISRLNGDSLRKFMKQIGIVGMLIEKKKDLEQRRKKLHINFENRVG